MGKIEWVIFDKDGTLIDLDSIWIPWAENVYLNLSENSDLKLDFSMDEFLTNIGVDVLKGKIDLISPLAIGSIQEAEVIIAYMLYQQRVPWGKGVCLAREATRKATENQIEIEVKELSGVRNLITNLKEKGIKLGVITADLTIRAENQLNKLNLLSEFEFIIGSDQVKYSKPFPDLAFLVKEQYEVNLNNTIMIGDSNVDMLFAKNAGMRSAIGIISNELLHKDYLPDASKIIQSYEELDLDLILDLEV